MRSSDYLSFPAYPLVSLPEGFEDERGRLQNLLDERLGTAPWIASVVLITSKAGTERANHWHKEDDHLCVVLQGGIDYYWQPLSRDHGGRAALSGVQRVHVDAGQAFYTPPYCAHTMHFTADTVFLALSPRSRRQEEYEADLVRVPSLRAALEQQQSEQNRAAAAEKMKAAGPLKLPEWPPGKPFPAFATDADEAEFKKKYDFAAHWAHIDLAKQGEKVLSPPVGPPVYFDFHEEDGRAPGPKATPSGPVSPAKKKR